MLLLAGAPPGAVSVETFTPVTPSLRSVKEILLRGLLVLVALSQRFKSSTAIVERLPPWYPV